MASFFWELVNLVLIILCYVLVDQLIEIDIFSLILIQLPLWVVYKVGCQIIKAITYITIVIYFYTKVSIYSSNRLAFSWFSRSHQLRPSLAIVLVSNFQFLLKKKKKSEAGMLFGNPVVIFSFLKTLPQKLKNLVLKVFENQICQWPPPPSPSPPPTLSSLATPCPLPSASSRASQTAQVTTKQVSGFWFSEILKLALVF